MAADACRALLFSAMNIGGVCFCAPTRTSDNGRRCSFAPVGNLFIGHRVPSAGRVGAYCIRPFRCPRRGQIRRRRISDRRYCFLPGNMGGVCNTPLHGRPTMAADVRSPPKWFPIAADACRALLFSAMNMGGVCNTPLHGRPTMADDTHSPLKCFPIGAAGIWAPLSECPTGAADAWAPLSECPTGAAGGQTPSKWFPTGRLFTQTPHLCIFLTASGAWRPAMGRTRTARTDPRPAMGKRK